MVVLAASFLFLNDFHRLTNMLRGKVRTLGPTSENDMDILIATRLDNSRKTLLGDTHESVRIGCGMHCVYGDGDAR